MTNAYEVFITKLHIQNFGCCFISQVYTKKCVTYYSPFYSCIVKVIYTHKAGNSPYFYR